MIKNFEDMKVKVSANLEMNWAKYRMALSFKVLQIGFESICKVWHIQSINQTQIYCFVKLQLIPSLDYT